MQISYKAVYHLLDRFTARRSLNGLIEGEIPEDIFNASLLFAHQREDYVYLDTMVTKRDYLNENYVFFLNSMITETPITIVKDKNLTLLEFALLYLQAPYVPLEEFRFTVEAQAEGKGQNPAEELKKFDWLIGNLPRLAVEVEAESKDDSSEKSVDFASEKEAKNRKKG